MGLNMIQKFKKYWGDPDKMNNLIFISCVLDPRYKIEYVSYTLGQMYGPVVGESLSQSVRNSLSELFADYVACYGKIDSASQESASQSSVSTSTISVKPVSVLKARFKQHQFVCGIGGSKKSDLDLYLTKSLLEEDGELDILKWWKSNCERLPILSKMARDILAVPISTVASEYAFSTSGRVLDSFRSSLTPRIVEALICSQD